jgi:Na+/H+ antiporter NhaD/arsenite permease-like protein
MIKVIKILLAIILPICCITSVLGANGAMPTIGGIRLEFFLFASILLGVALFHNQSFYFAIIGVSIIIIYKLIFDPSFHMGEHLFGHTNFLTQIIDKSQRVGEWSTILNLFGLLLGFALLAKIFEESGIPNWIPKLLPKSWVGPFLLLVIVFTISTFLDNIAAALIGGAIAIVVFNGKVHIGYIAAIVAASNAGGAGSVLGDTTTTMMWINGVSPLNVLHGFVASVTALLIFGWIAALQQKKLQGIIETTGEGHPIDINRIILVVLILGGAIATNFLFDMPALGVWAALLIGMLFVKLPWKEIPSSMQGTIFLLCLVFSASLMPVSELPAASMSTAFILGIVSAFFDNIPLTALCLEQGHYDWGMLAYSVGFGGSMIWFGSSAGVAITSKFPESRNVFKWVKNGWHVALAYVIGFFTLYLVMGWEPADNNKHKIKDCPVKDCPMAKVDAAIK